MGKETVILPASATGKDRGTDQVSESKTMLNTLTGKKHFLKTLYREQKFKRKTILNHKFS